MKNRKQWMYGFLVVAVLITLTLLGMKAPEILINQSIDAILQKDYKGQTTYSKISLSDQNSDSDDSGKWHTGGIPQTQQSEQMALSHIQQLIDDEVLPELETENLQPSDAQYQLNPQTQEISGYDVTFSFEDNLLSVQIRCENERITLLELVCPYDNDMVNCVPPITALSNMVKHDNRYKGELFMLSQNSALLSNEGIGSVYYCQNEIKNSIYHFSLVRLIYGDRDSE